MDALLVCAEEIALEGLDGCPIVHLWNNLEKTSIPFPLKLDDSVKNYLWTGIVEALDVSFCLLEQPLPRIFSSIEDESLQKFLDTCRNLDLDEQNIDVTMNHYSLVNDGKIRGSCPEYITRKDVTSEIRSASGQCVISLKEAQNRWGDRLVMVASQEMRSKVLLPDNVDPNVILSDVEYCILEHVAQARNKGRLQRCINIFLKIDSRTTFHFLKKMGKIGLVTKQRFVAHNTIATNICTNIIKLKRFHSPCYHKYDVLGHQICNKLLEQPDHIMALKDLREFCEKSGTRERIFKRIRQDLQSSGHVKIVMKRVPSKAKTNTTRPNRGNLRHYIKLIKPFSLSDNKQDDNDDDEEEDDDDDDDDNIQICDGNPNPTVVVELSLLKQMYDFIESKAEHGIRNMDIDKALKISRYERRALVNTLEKLGHIKQFLTYGGRQSFLRYVATPYVEASSYLSKLLEEEKKLDASKTVAGTGTSTPSMRTPGQTPLDSPCPSPGPSTQSTETMDIEIKDITMEEKKRKTKSALVGKVTYRTLKRNNFIIDYLKKQKVVKGFLPILKAIQEAEEKEGLESKMDRVCLKKSLTKLIDDGLIKRMATVININDTSHNAEFYLDISVSPQDSVVQVAIDQCRFRLYGEANRSKASSRKRTKTEADADEHKEEEEDEDEDVDPDKIISDHSLRYKYGYLAKFPRMRLLHEYLWQVIFGIKQRNQETKTDLPSTVKSEPKPSGSVDSGSEKTANKTSEVKIEKLSSGEFDPKTHDYDWIDYLEPFPLYDMPLGWFKLGDATSIMPLSVFCNIMGIVTEVDGLDEYYNNPKLKHTLFKDLPNKMQRLLKHKGRYRQSLCDIVSNLMCAGLLTPKQPIPNERLMTEVHFNRGAIVVDTSTSLPNYDHIREPASHKFSSKKFLFNPFNNVQAYWDEVMCVALNTPLGMRRAYRLPKDRRWFKFSYSEAPVILEDNIALPPGDGKGACGFDTWLHAHIGRNWSFSGAPMKFEIKYSGLKSISIKDVEPPAKKAKKTGKEASKKTKSKETDVADKPKPKSKSKRPSFEDLIIRPPKKPKSVGTNIRAPCFPDKKQQKQTQNASKHLISVDDVDREALTKVVGLRKTFSTDIDKILILCRIGLEIMKKTSYRNPYPFQDIRNIVHEYCEDASDKTAPNCQQRLLRLMKNPKNVTTINVCVAEYSSSKEFLGLDNPELPFSETFHSLVARLIELSRTRVACLEDTSQLSSTLDELYKRFYVQRLTLPREVLPLTADIAVLGPPIKAVRDIRVSVARDVIQMACHSEQAKYNHLGIFKLFDELNMDEKEEAFVELQKTGLIIRRKDLSSVTNLRRTLPFAPISVQLSYMRRIYDFVTYYDSQNRLRTFFRRSINQERYNQHFKPKGTQPSTFDESIQFLRQLNKSSEEASPQAHPTPIKLSEEKVVGGDIACILSLLTVNKITMEFHIPDEVLQTDEKQEINLRTKKKSTVQRKSSLPSSLISLKQLSSKHKKVSKKVESIEGQVGNKPKPNVKKARKTVKRKSESEKPGSIEEGCNDKSERSVELSEDGTKITNENVKRTSGSEDTDGEGWSKQKSVKKLTKVGTAEAKETGKPETKQDGSGEDSGKNKSALNHNTDSISSTVHEFVRPKAMSKEKPNEKDNPQEGMVVEAQKEGPAEVIQVNGTSSDIESQASIKQVKDKQRKRKTDKKLENVQGGTGTNEDTEDEALEDPFVNNQSSLHCKFSTTLDLSSMDHKLFTPVYYPDAPSIPSIDADKTTISKTLKRVGRMKSKGLTAPILLTNSSEVALINNCSLFVRPKVTSGSQGSVCDIDVPMDTQESDQSSDILAPRSLEVILKNPPTFDAYLNVNNEFNASDIQLCTSILEAANEMKGLGTSKALLKQIFQEKEVVLDQASYSLEQHLKKLCDANLLLQAGNFEKRYVCPSFARSWCIDFMKSNIAMPTEGNKDDCLEPDGIPPTTSATSESVNPDTSLQTEAGAKTVSNAEVATTESLTIQPAATMMTAVQEVTTDPVTTQPMASAATPSTTVQEVTTESVTTPPSTPVQAVTVSNSEVATTESLTAQPAATMMTAVQEVTTEPVTTQPVASAATPSTTVQAVTTDPVTTPPVASAATPSTVQEVTTEPVTTPPSTPVQAVTVSNAEVATTESLTAQPAATIMTAVQEVTTETVTTQPVASAATPSTTVQAVTTDPVPTQPVASPLVTSSDVSALTSESVNTTTHSADAELSSSSSSVVEMARDEKPEKLTPTEIQSASLTETVQDSSKEEASNSSTINPDTLTRSSGESVAILCRPWLEINGKINTVFLKSIISAILSDIMSKPGISQVYIAKKYVNIIRPVYFTELLEYLLSIGCVTKHTLSVTKPSSLFSTPTVTQDAETIIYYLPVVDCIVTLANAVKSWS